MNSCFPWQKRSGRGHSRPGSGIALVLFCLATSTTAAEQLELIEAVNDRDAAEIRQLQDAARRVLPKQGRDAGRQRIFRLRWDLFENDVTRLTSHKVRVSFFEDETCTPKKNRLIHRVTGFWNWSVVCREPDASFYLAIDIVNRSFSGVVKRGGVRSKIRSLDREHGVVYTVE